MATSAEEFNQQAIQEFHANAGRLGSTFEVAARPAAHRGEERHPAGEPILVGAI